ALPAICILSLHDALPIFLAASVSIAVVLSLFSPLFLRILATREYSRSLSCVPWLLLVQAVAVLQYPSSVGLYLGSATRWLPPIFSCGILVRSEERRVGKVIECLMF